MPQATNDPVVFHLKKQEKGMKPPDTTGESSETDDASDAEEDAKQTNGPKEDQCDTN